MFLRLDEYSEQNKNRMSGILNTLTGTENCIQAIKTDLSYTKGIAHLQVLSCCKAFLKNVSYKCSAKLLRIENNGCIGFQNMKKQQLLMEERGDGVFCFVIKTDCFS